MLPSGRASSRSKKPQSSNPTFRLSARSTRERFAPQLEEDQTVATRLEPLVVDQFTQLGLATSDAKPPPETGQVIQSAYDQIDYVTERKIEHPTMDAAFALGPELAATTRKLGADAVVFVNLRAWARSGAGSACCPEIRTLAPPYWLRFDVCIELC